jgi:hypothetical protein
MEERIIVAPTDRKYKIINKDSTTRACTVEIFKQGLYEGFIESLSSNGTIVITQLKKIQESGGV